jgi:AraC-like DNA-binding protein
VATIEARREVVLDRNSIVLIPRFQLFGLRQPEQDQGALTLLLDGSHLEDLALSSQAVLVTDAALGAGVAALIAGWQRPVRSDEQVPTIRSVLEGLAACGTPLAAARPRRTSSLVRVREYLRAQVSQPVTTEELCRMSGLSEPYLIRAFHYEFGLPPHAYHLRVRLAAACELLTRGRAVASVAYECGFADQSHLSRKFKAVYGLTRLGGRPGRRAGTVMAREGGRAVFAGAEGTVPGHLRACRAAATSPCPVELSTAAPTRCPTENSGWVRRRHWQAGRVGQCGGRGGAGCRTAGHRESSGLAGGDAIGSGGGPGARGGV